MWKFLGLSRDNYLFVAVIFTIGVIDVAFINQPLISFLVLVISSYFVGARINRPFFNTKFSSFVFGFIIISAVAGFISALLWIPHLGINLNVILYFTIIGLISITAKINNVGERKKLFDGKDIIAILVILTYLSGSVIGVTSHQGFSISSLSSATIQYATYGGDSLSHIMMYKDTVEANRGLLLGSRDSEYSSKKAFASYPKMSHTIASLIYRYSGKQTTKIVFAYALLFMLVFSLSIYIICRSTLELIDERLGFNKYRYIELAALSIPLFGFLLILPIHNFIEEGFFSIWPILVYSPFLLLWFNNKKSLEKIPTLSLIFIGIFTTIITMSWPILGVPIYIAFAVVWFCGKKNIGWRKYGALMLGSFGGLQFYVQKTDPVIGTSISSSGGIMQYPVPLIVATCIAATTVVLIRRPSKDSPIFNQAYVIILSIMLTFIAYLNIRSTGLVQYFYFKSSLIVCIILSILIVPSLVGILSRLLDKAKLSTLIERSIIGFLLSLSIVLGATLYFGLQGNVKYTLDYVLSNNRHISMKDSSLLLVSNNLLSRSIVLNLDSQSENFYINGYFSELNNLNSCQASFQSIGIGFTSESIKSIKSSCGESLEHWSLLVVDNPSINNQLSCEDLNKILSSIPNVNLNVKYYYTYGQCT
jgi:hypothetical protein